MYRKYFVRLSKLTIRLMYTTFNKSPAMSNKVTYMNFKTFEEYLRGLEHAQTDGQTNRMHRHFSTLLRIINNIKFEIFAVKLLLFFKCSLFIFYNNQFCKFYFI